MKRNMCLIRCILEYAESNATGVRIPAPDIRGFTEAEVHYHMGLCDQAGYLNVESAGANPGGPAYYVILNLTWSGHEVLEKLRA